jgi:hypothetical protein
MNVQTEQNDNNTKAPFLEPRSQDLEPNEDGPASMDPGDRGTAPEVNGSPAVTEPAVENAARRLRS